MVNQPKKRCVPCVEQKLRRLVRDKTLENRRLEAEVKMWQQQSNDHYLHSCELDKTVADKNERIAELREALEKITRTYGSAGAMTIARAALEVEV